MNQAMINKLRKMQKEMMETQERLENSVFEGSAGGGLVKVEVKGTKEILSVQIDPEILNPDDKEMIEDTIVAALNDAFRRVDKETEEAMAPYQALTGGFGF